MAWVATAVIGGAVVGSLAKGAASRQAASMQADAASQAGERQAAGALEAGRHQEEAAVGSRDYLLGGNTQAHDIRNTGYNSIESLNDANIEKNRGIQLDAVAGARDARIGGAQEAWDRRLGYANAAMRMIGGGGGGGGGSAAAANANTQRLLDQSRGDLAPYMAAGRTATDQLVEGTKAGGDLVRSFTNDDFVKDPGYQFRMDEGMKGVSNSAAARGGLLSGGTLKALNQYGQGFASNEFDKAYGRFSTDQGNRFSRLSSLADRGMGATSTMVGANSNAANTMSQAEMAAQGMNSQAGIAAASNAHSAGLARAGIMEGLSNTAYSNSYDIGGYKAGAIRDSGQYNVDANNLGTANKTDGITNRMNNDANYATGNAGINSNSTLAIGNARAGAAQGTSLADSNAILGRGNAYSAGAVAQGDMWGNIGNSVANGFTNMSALNNMGAMARNGFTQQPVSYANPGNNQMTLYR